MIGRWAREDVGDAGDARFARDEKLVFSPYEKPRRVGHPQRRSREMGNVPSVPEFLKLKLDLCFGLEFDLTVFHLHRIFHGVAAVFFADLVSLFGNERFE